MNWRDLEIAAPEIARFGRERFEASRVALVGTLRKDGSPRISPVEPYLVGDHLLLGMLRGSRKAADLRHDPRCVVHSSVSDANGSEGELKLDGRAVPVHHGELRRANEDAWWNAPNAPAASVFAIDVLAATFITWDIHHGNMTLLRWTADAGVTKRSQRY
jgi:pyridoxamine 5'-phosphate oxidase-like protein